MYEMGEAEIAAVSRVLNQRSFFRYKGPDQRGECDYFEQEFAAKLGAQHSLLLTSGTNALVLALHALGVGPGKKVLIPTYTFFATAAAVIQVGAVPVLCNIDEGLGICPNEVEAQLDAEVAAIIAVHMDGIACNMRALKQICERRNIPLIEDCAQALGGSYQGARLGSIGQVGCYSFNVDKIISCGEGGAVCTNDPDLHQHMFCMHDTCAQFGPSRKHWFERVFIGGSMRVSEISGAILREQLKRLDGILEQLRLRKGWLLQNLEGVSLVAPHCPEGDCATTLHLKLTDVQAATATWKQLSQAGVLSYHISMRYAHACWQWSHLLSKQQCLESQPNPFQQLTRPVPYHQAFYLPTIELLNRLVYIPIDINWTRQQTERVASSVKKCIIV